MNENHTARTQPQHSNDHETIKSLLISQIDSMDSLNILPSKETGDPIDDSVHPQLKDNHENERGKSKGAISEELFLHLKRLSTVTCNPQLKEKNKNDRVDSDSKMNEDAKTSPDKVSTAAIKTNTSDRNDRNVKRNQAKRREKNRKYSNNRYATQSDEQKKEKAIKRKQKREDEWKKKYDNRHNKMTTEEINHLTKTPDKEYKTIQTNNDECISIPTRRHRSKKCDCADMGEKNCTTNCNNANRKVYKANGDHLDCPIECTPDNCSFGETDCKNRVLLEEQYINDCFPSKKNNVGTALCATKDIQQGVLIGQYLGVVTTKRNGTSESNYIAQMAKPNMENGHSKMWVDAEKCGNLTRFINHSCEPNVKWEQREVNKRQTLWIRTIKLIRKKNQLTIDYGEKASAFFSDGVCQCGENCCRYIRK